MQTNDILKCIQKVIFDHTFMRDRALVRACVCMCLTANEQNQFARAQAHTQTNTQIYIDVYLNFIVSLFHLFYIWLFPLFAVNSCHICTTPNNLSDPKCVCVCVLFFSFICLLVAVWLVLLLFVVVVFCLHLRLLLSFFIWLAYSVFGFFHSLKHRFYVFFGLIGIYVSMRNVKTIQRARGCTIIRSPDRAHLHFIIQTNIYFKHSFVIFSKICVWHKWWLCEMWYPLCAILCVHVILDTVFGHRCRCLFCQFLIWYFFSKIFFLRHKFLFDSHSRCLFVCLFVSITQLISPFKHTRFFSVLFRYNMQYDSLETEQQNQNDHCTLWVPVHARACVCVRNIFLGHFIHAFYWNFY